MTCLLDHDPAQWISDDLADAAQMFAAKCDVLLEGHDFNLVLGEDDPQEPDIAWLYWFDSSDEEQLAATISREEYCIEDDSFLDFGEAETLDGLLSEMCSELA